MPNPDLRSAAYQARQVIAAHQSDNLGNDPDSAFAAPLAALNLALDPPTPAQLRAKALALCEAQPGYGSPSYRGDPVEAVALQQEADKLAESLIDETAGRIVGEDVRLCVSWLVSELMQRTGERDSIMDDEERDALAGRGPDADDMRDQMPSNYRCEQGVDPSDGEKAWRWWDGDDEDGAPLPENSVWFETEEEALADLYESEGLDPADGSEAFEHWAVSSWLADKLRAKGESVAETNFAGHVWARCTTGQMIRMDHVIRQIARDLCARELTGVDL